VNAGSKRTIRGFTLVELMVGLTVGLLVSVASISVFVSTRKLQTVGSAKSHMGENARLAMELMEKDFRSAGFLGCKPLLEDAPVSLLAASGGLFLDSASGGLGGSHGDGSAFTPALNDTFAGLPQPPSASSDVVSVRVPIEPLSLGLAAPMTTSSGVPSVGANTPGNAILSGDIVLIANCKAGAMFQVTEASPATTGALTHGTGGSFYPGNATSDLQQAFHGDAAVYRLATHHYYIAPSVLHVGTNSMWRYTFPNNDGSANPQEVVQGVDRMLVTYGIDAGDQTVSKYVDASGVTSWSSVIAARIRLLTASVADNVTLGLQAASFAGTNVVPTDHRLRSELTQVVTLRNHAP
jgi:type IV pilus assembly protein PilW